MELDNFIRKFKLLRQSGYDAHLDVDSHAGQAWIGLRVNLGNHPDIQKTKDEYGQPRQRNNGPSRQRRRERHDESRNKDFVFDKEIVSKPDSVEVEIAEEAGVDEESEIA